MDVKKPDKQLLRAVTKGKKSALRGNIGARVNAWRTALAKWKKKKFVATIHLTRENTSLEIRPFIFLAGVRASSPLTSINYGFRSDLVGLFQQHAAFIFAEIRVNFIFDRMARKNSFPFILYYSVFFTNTIKVLLCFTRAVACSFNAFFFRSLDRYK